MTRTGCQEAISLTLLRGTTFALLVLQSRMADDRDLCVANEIGPESGAVRGGWPAQPTWALAALRSFG